MRALGRQPTRSRCRKRGQCSKTSSPTASGRAKSSRGSASPCDQAPRKEGLDINPKISGGPRPHGARIPAATTSLFGQSSDGTVPRVAGDRVQPQQVPLNLIMNAWSMGESAVHDRQREREIVSTAGRFQRRASRSARFRPRPGRTARCRAGVRGVLHDEAEAYRHRPVDQLLDRRGARRAAVGEAERTSRGGLPLSLPVTGEAVS